MFFRLYTFSSWYRVGDLVTACMFFLVYILFLQAGTAYHKVLIKQRNLSVNRQGVNILCGAYMGIYVGLGD